MMTKLNSLVLTNVKCFLIIGVFLSHAAGCVNSELLDIYKDASIIDNVFYWLYVSCITIMPMLVIPTFFLISGYLFFLKWNQDGNEKVWDWKCYVSKLRSRLFTLLIPYIIWNIMPLLVIIVQCVVENIGKPELMPELRHCFQGKFPQMFWDINKWDGDSTGPLNLPLYYIRDLMGMCLVSPLVFLLCKKTRAYGIIVLILLNVLGFIPSVSGLRNTGITFFTLGAYFSIMNKDMVDVMYKYGKYCFLFFVPMVIMCVGALHVDGVEVYNNRLFPLVAMFVLVWFVRKFSLKHKFPKVYMDSVFFMYVAHEGLYILMLTIWLSTMILPSSNMFCLFAQYVFTIISTIALCIALYAVLRKTMPLVCDVLCGKYK